MELQEMNQTLKEMNQTFYEPTSPPTVKQQFQQHLRVLSQDKYCCPQNPTTRHIVDLLLSDVSKEERFEKQVKRFLRRAEPRQKTLGAPRKQTSTTHHALKDSERDPWWNDRPVDWVQARAHETEEIKSVTTEHLSWSHLDQLKTEDLEECPPPEALFPEVSHVKGRKPKRLRRRVVSLYGLEPRAEPVFFTPMFLMMFPQLYPTAWQEWARRSPYVIPVPSPYLSRFPRRRPAPSTDGTT